MPFSLATYNVLDLFDVSEGVTREHLDAKLAFLASTLERMNADVVGFQEVGSGDVLRELVARVPRLGYGEPVVGTADARGIRCAIVSRLPFLESRVHTAESLPFPIFYAGDPSPFGARLPLRRGIVGARIDVGGSETVDVLVGHFKSGRALPLRDANGEVPLVTPHDFAEARLRTLVWRGAEALFVRGLVDDLLEASPERHVVVAGDLNDRPSSTVLQIVSGGGPLALFPCADLVPQADRYSILHRGERQQIDHILVTQGLRARLASARFLNEGLRDHSEFEDDAPPPADSDHAPFVVSFG